MSAAPPPRTGPSKKRILAARILVVLAALIGLVAALAGYVRYQALDTETFEGTASELIADDTVRNEIGARMVDQLFSNVDVAAELETTLPENLQPLAGPIAGASRQLADRAAVNLLERPRIQELWITSLVTTQEQLKKLLDGDTTVVQNTDGFVVLNLQPLVIQLGDEVAVIGRVANTLPPDAGLIKIMDADNLTLAQDITNLLNTLGLWLWVVPLLLFGAAVAIVPGRRRLELRAIALAAILVGLLILMLRGIAGRYIVENLVQYDSSRPAAQDAWNIITDLLRQGGWTIVGLGVILLFGVWLAGPSRTGSASRRFVAPFLAHWWMAYAIYLFLALLLLWWGPTEQTRRPLQMFVFIVIFALGFEGLRRLTMRDVPGSRRDVSGSRAHRAVRELPHQSRGQQAARGARPPRAPQGSGRDHGRRVPGAQERARLTDASAGRLAHVDPECDRLAARLARAPARPAEPVTQQLERTLDVVAGELLVVALEDRAAPHAGPVVGVHLEADARIRAEHPRLQALDGEDVDALAVPAVDDRHDVGGSVRVAADAPHGLGAEQLVDLLAGELVHSWIIAGLRPTSHRSPSAGRTSGTNP